MKTLKDRNDACLQSSFPFTGLMLPQQVGAPNGCNRSANIAHRVHYAILQRGEPRSSEQCASNDSKREP